MGFHASPAERLLRARELLETSGDLATRERIARELREIADELVAYPAVHRPSLLRTDRVVSVRGTDVPVLVVGGEPLEVIGVGIEGLESIEGGDRASLCVELHNPSHDEYSVHGHLLVRDDAGATVARHEFVIEALEALDTHSVREAVRLPGGDASITLVVSVDVAGQ